MFRITKEVTQEELSYGYWVAPKHFQCVTNSKAKRS